jgi:predicted nuclease of predicted toxin-antitoxin system
MIFIDRSVPKPVAEAIKMVRDDVLWLEDRFPHNTKDEVWLAAAGRNEWLVITRDKHIRWRPGEREKIIRHGVGCFIINQKQDPTKWEYLQLIAGALDEMQEKFAATQRPFIYLIDRQGRLRRYI